MSALFIITLTFAAVVGVAYIGLKDTKIDENYYRKKR